jgi:hypothetical protein
MNGLFVQANKLGRQSNFSTSSESATTARTPSTSAVYNDWISSQVFIFIQTEAMDHAGQCPGGAGGVGKSAVVFGQMSIK